MILALVGTAFDFSSASFVLAYIQYWSVYILLRWLNSKDKDYIFIGKKGGLEWKAIMGWLEKFISVWFYEPYLGERE